MTDHDNLYLTNDDYDTNVYQEFGGAGGNPRLCSPQRILPGWNVSTLQLMFPLGLEKWGNIFQSWNLTQNTGKIRKKFYWRIGKKIQKSQGNSSASNSENPANMAPYFKLKKEL